MVAGFTRSLRRYVQENYTINAMQLTMSIAIKEGKFVDDYVRLMQVVIQ